MRSPSLLALVALSALTLSCSKPPPAQPPAPSATAPEVTVTSTPPGAEVVFDGFPRGLTPVTFRMDPGRYRMVVKKSGYLASETNPLVEVGHPTQLTVTLIASH